MSLESIIKIVRALLVLTLAASSSYAQGLPDWAYGFETPPVGPPASARKHDDQPRHLPGSDLTFSAKQINDPFGPPDWFPNDHPKMPDIVANGRRPAILACALCHYPNGKGRPENASVVGFPREYFLQQMRDFRSGNRHSADPRKRNTNVMVALAKAMTDEELDAAAAYFSSMKWTPWIKVVETKSVPKMYTEVGMFLPLPGNEKEPLRDRIIETPVDPELTELRDFRSGFIAYAPLGSVRKGEALVAKESATTTPCAICHGDGLKGLGPVPGIAGRSPSYLVRQLYDMQQGTRKGLWSDLMKPVVAKLSEDDMLNIAAYVASQNP
ncbi:MAG: c-type cytochrome [Bryobacteraceae bacterium]